MDKSQNNEMLCPGCGQPLQKVNFNGGVVAICVNWQCRLYRQHQVIKVKPRKSELWDYSWYPQWRKQRNIDRRKRYQAIRDLKIDSKSALLLRDMTSLTIEDIKELA